MCKIFMKRVSSWFYLNHSWWDIFMLHLKLESSGFPEFAKFLFFLGDLASDGGQERRETYRVDQWKSQRYCLIIVFSSFIKRKKLNCKLSQVKRTTSACTMRIWICRRKWMPSLTRDWIRWGFCPNKRCYSDRKWWCCWSTYLTNIAGWSGSHSWNQADSREEAGSLPHEYDGKACQLRMQV